MPENIEVQPIEVSNKMEENKLSSAETPTVDLIVKEPIYDLRRFQLTRVLNNNTVRKSIALLGRFPYLSTTDEAIVLFEKQAFQETEVKTDDVLDEPTDGKEQKETLQKPNYFNDGFKVQVEFINNIYGSFLCMPNGELNAIKTTVVYPATEKHIEKYSICQKYLIAETPALYENLTLPYITSSQFSLDWVYNILEHKQETERIIFEDNDPENGFVLLPDLKWDGRNVDTLYLLAITHKRYLKSLRDLTAEHLPLLRNIRTRAAAAIEERYGLNGAQLRMYFHYQPSFYHLHVHVNPIRNDTPGIWCEKSHMLDTVISNLELLPDYYQRVTLPFIVYDGNKLLELFEQEFKVRKRSRLSVSADVSTTSAKNKDEQTSLKNPLTESKLSASNL